MKTFKRIVLGILIALAILILFIPASIFVDSFLGAERLDKLVNTTVPGANGGPDVRAYVARPQGEGPFPTVIMIHEFYGLRESIIGKADLLAQEGYLVIAPDTFRGASTAWIPRAIYQVASTNAEDVNTDLDSIYVWLESQPDVDPNRIAIAGFCYGGRTSLTYSLHNDQLAATVVFYGSPETDPAVLMNLPGPLLGIFGGADQSIPVEEVEAFDKALDKASVTHTVSIYEGQPHAFVEDAAGIQAGGAQGDAWAEMLSFLDENLGNAPSSRNSGSIAYDPGFDWYYYAMLAYEHAFGTASH